MFRISLFRWYFKLLCVPHFKEKLTWNSFFSLYLFIYFAAFEPSYKLTCLSSCPGGSCRLRGSGCFAKVKYQRAWMRWGGTCAGSEGYLLQMFGVLSRKREMGGRRGVKVIFLSRSVMREKEQTRPRAKKEKKVCSCVVWVWLLGNWLQWRRQSHAAARWCSPWCLTLWICNNDIKNRFLSI